MDLTGKVALITGASSGIGEGVARNLAEAGMKLVLTARRESLLNVLADELETETAVVAGDIADPALPETLVGTAVERFGSCDVVFNNAGVMVVGPVAEIDIDAACRMVRTNVEGPMRLAYVAMRQMLQQGRGDLINTSSILGLKVRMTTGPYAATKYAIEALSEDLRMQAAGTGVRICVLEPGVTETHLQDHFAVHPIESMHITTPPQPADIARTVRFVLEQPAHVSIPRILVMPSEQAM